MIRLLLFSLFIFNTEMTSLRAQTNDVTNPVHWTFSIEKQENGSYLFRAEADIRESFHIWAGEPGGDGSLIPTTISFDDSTTVLWQGNWKESPAPATHELEFVEGAVRWHEGKVTFSREFKGRYDAPISGEVTFQSCNESSCFPPESQHFQLRVRE